MKRSELRNLIKALGGPKVVGRACKGISSQAVSHWTQVPQEHCPTIERLAREKRVVRSDGSPYTCEVFRPEVEWSVLRGAPAAFVPVGDTVAEVA